MLVHVCYEREHISRRHVDREAFGLLRMLVTLSCNGMKGLQTQNGFVRNETYGQHYSKLCMQRECWKT